MRILIAYSGKYQTARTCVERLVAALGGLDVTVADLEREAVDPSAFELVVFGASVYFGRFRPAARRFLQTHGETLASRPLALFLCCGLTEEHEHYLETLFPPALQAHAFQMLYFGGTLHTEGRSFLDRLAIRSMRSALFERSMDDGEYQLTLPTLLPENVDRMATYIRNEATKPQRAL